MTRDDCVDLLHAKVVEEFPITRGAYAATLANWDLQPVEIDGAPVGAVMIKDHEIHVVVGKEHAVQYHRRILRKCLLDNLARHGYLTTRAFKGDKVATFLTRLGFYKTHEDDTFDWYRIDQAKIH